MNSWINLAAIVIFAGLFVLSDAWAHPGRLAADGCHTVSDTGKRHYHAPDTSQAAGACVTDDAGHAYRVPVENNISHGRIKVIESALGRQIDRLEQVIADMAARQPRVVRVATQPGDTTEACRKLRSEFLSCSNSWGCSTSKVGLNAIAAGCW